MIQRTRRIGVGSSRRPRTAFINGAKIPKTNSLIAIILIQVIEIVLLYLHLCVSILMLAY